jgi:hypothetical protein
VGRITYPGILVCSAAYFKEVDACVDEQADLGHGVFEGGGGVVCGVELDADAEGCGDDFACLREDVEDELGSLLGGAAVGVGS